MSVYSSFNRITKHSGSLKSLRPCDAPKSANTNYVHKSAHVAGLHLLHSMPTEHTGGSGPTIDVIIGTFILNLTHNALMASTNELPLLSSGTDAMSNNNSIAKVEHCKMCASSSSTILA